MPDLPRFRVEPLTGDDAPAWHAMRRMMGPEWLTDDFEPIQ